MSQWSLFVVTKTALAVLVATSHALPSDATKPTPTDKIYTSLPDYCRSTWASVYSPTYTIQQDLPAFTPPLPCPGAYSTQDGACCSGSCISCPNSAFCGPQVANYTSSSSSAENSLQLRQRSDPPTCSCPDGELLYQMPLEPCVSNNPFYSGCPGSMSEGLCCSGPGILYTAANSSDSASLAASESVGGANDENDDDSGENDFSSVTSAQCYGNTALFTVLTINGAETALTTTSTLPPGISYTNSVCGTCLLYTRSTSTSKAGAAKTAFVRPAVITGAAMIAGNVALGLMN